MNNFHIWHFSTWQNLSPGKIWDIWHIVWSGGCCGNIMRANLKLRLIQTRLEAKLLSQADKVQTWALARAMIWLIRTGQKFYGRHSYIHINQVHTLQIMGHRGKNKKTGRNGSIFWGLKKTLNLQIWTISHFFHHIMSNGTYERINIKHRNSGKLPWHHSIKHSVCIFFF